MVRRIPGGVFVSVLAVAFLGCGADEPEPLIDSSFDPNDDRRVVRFDFEVQEDADFEGLAAQELTHSGPLRDARGRTIITMYATGRLAAQLAEHGFDVIPENTVRGYRQGDDVGGAVVGHHVTAHCDPPVIPTPSTSKYLWKWDDIKSELDLMDAADSAIRAHAFGVTEKEGLDIIGVQFGPLEPIDDPPTVYVLGTHHAREWMSTGVAFHIAQRLTAIVQDRNEDPAIHDALIAAAVVVVPVVNIDGYEETRNGNRSWRGNLNTNDCANGVDLNRNHTAGHGIATIGTGACGFTYPGPDPASESETKALEELLDGSAFASVTDDHTPVAVISYHSFANMVLYPDGFNDVGGSTGPLCELKEEDYNCFNPDFTIMRHLFGDTHSQFASPPLFVDPTTTPARPYLRDHPRTTLYAVSGDVGLQAAHKAATPMLAITPELPNTEFNFFIECETDFDSIITDVGEGQMDVLRRVVIAAPGLASTTPGTAYGPNAVGTLAPGLWTREYWDGGPSQATARATFTKAVFRPSSTGSLAGRIGMTNVTYDRGRTAAQYELFYLDDTTGGFDPLCVPCRIDSGIGQVDDLGDMGPCTGCIDLCDSGRLDYTSGAWSLEAGTRGGADDCWWEPTDVDENLRIPGGPIPVDNPGDTTHCHFTFSLLIGSSLGGARLVVERDAGTSWEEVWTIPYRAPINNEFLPDGRIISLAFEANRDVASDKVQDFRLRVETAVPSSGQMMIFDPILFCRTGPLT